MRLYLVLCCLLIFFYGECVVESKITCGEPVIKPITARVFGGTTAIPGSWPWLAIIVDNLKYIVGTGAILHPHVILTTAQHFEQKGLDLGMHELRNYKIFTGDFNISGADEHEAVHRFARVVIHPGYDFNNLENDLALILTEQAIVFNDHTRPICLPDGLHPTEPGHVCYRAGWGSTARSKKARFKTMMQMHVPVVKEDACASRWSDYLQETEFCAGIKGLPKIFCPDDIGAPLMCQYETNGPWVAQGIASSGTACNKQNVPGVYVDLHLYSDWIKNTMKDAGFAYQY